VGALVKDESRSKDCFLQVSTHRHRATMHYIDNVRYLLHMLSVYYTFVIHIGSAYTHFLSNVKQICGKMDK